jgi:hypothetical protein
MRSWSLTVSKQGGLNFAEILDEAWLHMRAGGNWGGEKRTMHRTRVARFSEAARRLEATGLN